MFYPAAVALQRDNNGPDEPITLLRIIQRNHYKLKFNGKYCYVYNARFENVKFSIIQWNDCHNPAYTGNKVCKGSPVIFGKVSLAQSKNGKKYFKITGGDSFIYYNFIHSFRKLFFSGLKDHESDGNAVYLWPSMKVRLIDYLYYDPITKPQFITRQDAINYCEKEANRGSNKQGKQYALFKLPSKFIIKTTSEKATFKYWCPRCKKVNKGLYLQCCQRNELADSSWIELAITPTWKWNIPNHELHRLERSEEIRITLSLLKNMYILRRSKNILIFIKKFLTPMKNSHLLTIFK